MDNKEIQKLQSINDFPELVEYLRDELDWPIETDHFDDLTFEYTAEELGIDEDNAAKILEIKRLRPLDVDQPWGIFFVRLEPKRLPVVALRRLLSKVAIKKRASANKADQVAWNADDILFISSFGDHHERQLSFAHFAVNKEKNDLPILKVLGWDVKDTKLHVEAIVEALKEKLIWPEDVADTNSWREQWREAFTLSYKEVVSTSKEMAIRLAELARNIRDSITSVLSVENDTGPLRQIMKTFRDALIHDLDEEGFADMYAQTIAYGLLSARIADPQGSNTAEHLGDHMRTNPFLKELMETFLDVGGRKRGKQRGAGLDFDELGVSEVVDLLDSANMEAVVRDFGDRNPQEDPVIHFYESFLKEYDAQKRVQRGVYYTPQPIVSYIVRSVHELLQTEFGLTDGLADTSTWSEMLRKHPEMNLPPLTDEPGEKRTISPDEPFVQILDPATGTATFLVEVIEVIHQTLLARWAKRGLSRKELDVAWNDYVPQHLLPRLHAFELMMAPYAIAHMKFGLKLAETGYRFTTEERARIYLTNALEPWVKQLPLIGFDALAHEAAAVNEIKKYKRFTVVIGNPPYAGVSSNEGPWIKNLIRSPLADGAASYFTFNGAPLDEPNTRWLNDDYVKFLRLAQREVANSQIGIAGLITNHSWFENPTFRGMRQSTTKTFPQVYLLDLHGNTKKKEIAPDGSKDENVFDIQQGVAISLLVSRDVDTSIRHADLFGLRNEKYENLQRKSVETTEWHSLTPDPGLMLWRLFDATNSDEYESFPAITDVFSSTGDDGRGSSWAKGLATTKDHLFISFDRAEAFEKIGMLASTTDSDSYVGEKLSLRDTPYFKISDARHAIRKGDWKARVCSVTYRPFDTRVLYWHPELYDVGRGASSKRVMSHLFKPNIALVTSRMTKGETFAHTFVTRLPVEVIFLSSKTSNNAFVFPLQYYPDFSSQMGLQFDKAHFQTNLNPKFLHALAQGLGVSGSKDGLPARLTPEDIFNYAYAVFHSPGYRSRYEEFLKIDFPRLPLTWNLELFFALAQFGGELTALHLLESPELGRSLTEFIGSNQQVSKVIYTADNGGTVWIDGKGTVKNPLPGTSGFFSVPEEIWNFHIGGYQVCEKWLKDRGPKKGNSGRTLTDEDIAHYQKIVIALTETIRIMSEIDEVIEQHGGWPDAFVTGDNVNE